MEKNKILMIVIIVLLVVLLSAIGVLGFSLAKFMKADSNAANPKQTIAAEALTLSISEVELVPLAKAISTNLKNSADGTPHIISVNLSVGVNNTDKKKSPVIIEMLTTKELIVRDVCLNTIRSKTFEELKKQDGPDILREEILTKLRDEFQSNLIYQVYLGDIYME